MKNRLDLAAEPFEPGMQIVDRHDLEKIALGDVAPFLVMAEAVDNDKIAMSGLIQRGREHRADKPAATRDNQHQAASSFERARATRVRPLAGVARIASMSRV